MYKRQICLGAVIRGSTSHYDYVCNEVSKGIATVSLESGVPVLFGCLLYTSICQVVLDLLFLFAQPLQGCIIDGMAFSVFRSPTVHIQPIALAVDPVSYTHLDVYKRQV